MLSSRPCWAFIRRPFIKRNIVQEKSFPFLKRLVYAMLSSLQEEGGGLFVWRALFVSPNFYLTSAERDSYAMVTLIFSSSTKKKKKMDISITVIIPYSYSIK